MYVFLIIIKCATCVHKGKVVTCTHHETYGEGGSYIRLHSFLTSAPDGGDWYTSQSSHFIPKTVWKLRRRETLFPFAKIRAPNHPARSLLTILTALSRFLQVRPTYNLLRDLPAKNSNHDFPLYVYSPPTYSSLSLRSIRCPKHSRFTLFR